MYLLKIGGILKFSIIDVRIKSGRESTLSICCKKKQQMKGNLSLILERKENMLKKTEIEKKCEELVQPIVDAHQFELVDVEFVKEGSNYYLRVYADKEGGINIDDCVTISRELEAKLDADDFIDDAYILEVSSPGLGRPLKKDKDLQRSIGSDVEVKLYKAIEKQKEFEGQLIAFDENTITIQNGQEITFNRNDIALIRLALDF